MYRRKAKAFAELVNKVEKEATRDYLRHMERSYTLLARNADWLQDTEHFLKRLSRPL